MPLFRFTGNSLTHTHDGKHVATGDVVELNDTQAQAWADKFVKVEDVAESHPAGLQPNGPTIEEYVAAGYVADNYPPDGFAAVESEGLSRYLETGSIEETPADTTDPEATPATDPE